MDELRLRLRRHPFVVMKNGQPEAFFSNITLACVCVEDRRADGVVERDSGQSWDRADCLRMAHPKFAVAVA